MGRVAREREAGQGGNGAKPFDGTRPGTSQAPVPWGELGSGGGGGMGRQRRDACAQRGVGQKAKRPKGD